MIGDRALSQVGFGFLSVSLFVVALLFENKYFLLFFWFMFLFHILVFAAHLTVFSVCCFSFVSFSGLLFLSPSFFILWFLPCLFFLFFLSCVVFFLSFLFRSIFLFFLIFFFVCSLAPQKP